MMAPPHKTKRRRSDSDAAESKAVETVAVESGAAESKAIQDDRLLEELDRMRQQLNTAKANLNVANRELDTAKAELNNTNEEFSQVVRDYGRLVNEYANVCHIQQTDRILQKRVGEAVDAYRNGGSMTVIPLLMLHDSLDRHRAHVNGLIMAANSRNGRQVSDRRQMQ
ncbi:hypothetical protein VE03_09645 [Pseudogymnoascus sp. 23342-1-I1]|nr:hypothetical protein VE03_09645 [Pseudogymnoascus sp. 23342-1-I1]